MYNSRPRYNRYTSEISVPENYSGNAFRESAPTEEEEVELEVTESAEEAMKSEDISVSMKEEEAIPVLCEPQKKKGLFSSPAGFGLNIGKLFGDGIGFEELLILGLILLVAQGEGNDDVVLLLALLLFIG